MVCPRFVWLFRFLAFSSFRLLLLGSDELVALAVDVDDLDLVVVLEVLAAW